MNKDTWLIDNYERVGDRANNFSVEFINSSGIFNKPIIRKGYAYEFKNTITGSLFIEPVEYKGKYYTTWWPEGLGDNDNFIEAMSSVSDSWYLVEVKPKIKAYNYKGKLSCSNI